LDTENKIPIKEQYIVLPIKREQTLEWISHKHYAKRVPLIMLSYGLYDKRTVSILSGICTFGPPARMQNEGYGIFGGRLKVRTYELNRLVVNEGLANGVLSFFLSHVLKAFPKPACIVSYADSSAGHHGYIYQATNWIYTGKTEADVIFKDKKTGKQIHRRTINSRFGTSDIEKVPKEFVDIDYEEQGKYRYVFFLGNKKEVKEMKSCLAYPIETEYPKGDNERYDASFKISSSQISMNMES
jgi:hypothetical protein